MSQVIKTVVRPKCYLDSVALMRYSKQLQNIEGVVEAAMMMGTASNIEIMRNAGLLSADVQTIGAGDLIVGVLAQNDQAAEQAYQQAVLLIDAPASSASGVQWRPRSIRRAVEENADANLALISVPGEFAISEARKAIRRNLHVMIFSDNVAIEQERALKEEALSLGKLVMGPDCGTAIINGVPLAFANKMNPGNIGIIGASGTGIQEVCCLLAEAGLGVSQAVGVGGRDLKAEVGGLSTLMAMDMLEADTKTKQIVLISKPPAADVAEKVLAKAAASAKPYTICFIGGDEPALAKNCSWSITLHDAALNAIALSHTEVDGLDPDQAQLLIQDQQASKFTGKLIRGLYCGGTLCAEAQVILSTAQKPVSSNAAIPGVNNSLDAAGHTIIDLGSDEYTLGKPHPMIEPSVRDEAVAQALEDKNVGVMLFDVVLGYGSHADPAGHLVSSLPVQAFSEGYCLIASVTGTEQDPQIKSQQIRTLQKAGIVVANSNASAAKLALQLVS